MRKDIVLFGTGQYFENYMWCYGADERQRPIFAVDNDISIVGHKRLGVMIQSPQTLQKLPEKSFYVIICCAKYMEIATQLEAMGITDYQYYCPVPVERAIPMELSANGEEQRPAVRCEVGKPYETGYVPGVFDLFHVGHLNLLRNAKARCRYLIVGVLTDELVEYFKKRRPIIPYAQRAAVVGGVSYVDRVVPVDFGNTRKIDAWHRYHFDCHFSGNDHGADWVTDCRQLREVGANMEFFSYTRAISSTEIREKLLK